MVLDKTGTVTEGKPKVTDLLPAPGRTEEELLCVAHRFSGGPVRVPAGSGHRGRAKDRSIPLPGGAVWGQFPARRYSGAIFRGNTSGRATPVSSIPPFRSADADALAEARAKRRCSSPATVN